MNQSQKLNRPQLSTKAALQAHFSSYQLDACNLLGNRLQKKLREHFSCLKLFANVQETNQIMGRYANTSMMDNSVDITQNAYNIRNNSSLMID